MEEAISTDQNPINSKINPPSTSQEKPAENLNEWDKQNPSDTSEDESFKKGVSVGGKMNESAFEMDQDSLFDNFKVKTQLVSLLLYVKERRWIATFRSPMKFLHFNEFSLPKSREEVQRRFSTNSVYFMTNYFALLLVMLLYTIISNPFLVVFMALIGYLWLMLSKRERFQITENFSIEGKAKYALLVSLAAVLFFLLAGKLLAVIFVLFFGFTSMHMMFHGTVSSEEPYNELNGLVPPSIV